MRALCAVCHGAGSPDLLRKDGAPALGVLRPPRGAAATRDRGTEHVDWAPADGTASDA